VSLNKFKIQEQWLSNVLFPQTLSLHPQPLRTPPFSQPFFNYWVITYGRLVMRAPQPSQQKKILGLPPIAVTTIK